MHDIRAIRDDPAAFNAALERRGLAPQAAAVVALDEKRRAAQTQLQELQQKRNTESQKIGEIKKAGGDAQGAMDTVSALKDEMAALEEEERAIAEELRTLLSGLPNILADDVPDGADEHDNHELYKWGDIKSLKGPQHFEIGEALGLMDFETAARMSGSRFVVLSGALARLERALAQFFLDTHTGEHGYTEVSPPLLVRDEALFGTGQLPKFGEDSFNTEGITEAQLRYEIDNYNKNLQADKDCGVDEETINIKYFFEKFILQQKVKDSKKWLIPTSEVPLTNIVADQIVETESLPRRYTAFTPCFRSEAGSAGKDTRGMLRQHQFYKVEMVAVTTPEESEAEQERMLGCAEAVLKKLDLPFRTVVLCSGDTGFGATKTYDIEVWLPGQETYREVSSVSNCKDFQARRMNARMRGRGEKATRFLHTLNGSGVAVGRALIAVMENYYDPADGGVFVPEVLKPYMGGLEKIVKTGA